MKKKLLIIMAGLLLISLNVFADDVSIDSNGNVKTGVSNTNAELEVTGASGEGGIVGSASGTGASGMYGINTTSGNYGILGYDSYGVFGYSLGGWAGYFQGNARVTGNLTVDGYLIGPAMGDITGVTAGTGLTGGGTSGNVTVSANIGTLPTQVAAGSHAHNYDSAYVNEGQADSITSGMIVDGAGSALDADLLDGQHAAEFSSATHNHSGTFVQKAGDTMTGALSLPANGLTAGGTQLVLSGGKVGIGTATPGEKLHVSGNLKVSEGNIELRSEGYDPYIELTSNDAGDSTTMRIKSLDAVGFAVTDYADVTKFVVTQPGNVGVGTTDPAEKLEVVGTVKSQGLQVTTGAVAGRVLTSDITGHATWQALPATASHAHAGGDITSGTVLDAMIDAAIARDSEVTSSISTHTSNASAHHTKYTDAARQLPRSWQRMAPVLPWTLICWTASMPGSFQ